MIATTSGADAELTPRDDAFPAWDDVPDKLKAYYARQMEVYAGFSENADYNVGRVIDATETRVLSAIPRLPVSTLPIHEKYCAMSDWSIP